LDTVILNSVVQYFPDLEYLLEVLEFAVERVAPGGRIFLGDIRNLHLQEVFHHAVQFAKAGPQVNRRQLQSRIRQALRREKELVIAPEFFEGLPSQLKRVSGVQICLKRGHAQNELTRYRYDVIVQVEGAQPCAPAHRFEWGAQSAPQNTQRLEDYLRAERPS